MFRRVASVVLLAGLLAGVAPAQTMPTPNAPTSPADSNIFEELNRDLKQRGREVFRGDDGSLGTVKPALSKMCDICKQPMFRHGDPTFECLPLDENGNPRELPKIETRPAQCPVCSAQFNGAMPSKKPNNRLGHDRDFCTHSRGRYTVHSRVWLCPDCGYAGLIEGFGQGLDGKPLPEDVKAFVRQDLMPPLRERMAQIAGVNPTTPNKDLLVFSRYIQQMEIPDWVKYDHAVRLLEKQKAPATVMARMYWEGAHACRREVNGEILVPHLNPAMMESLGKSIRRVNIYLQAEAQTILRERGAKVIDPTVTVTDPDVLALAAERIIKRGEEVGANQRANPQPNASGADESFFTTGDMLVLYVRQGGILDRQGRIDAADSALEKALKLIPEKMSVQMDGTEVREMEDYATKQLKRLRTLVLERRECLKREREWLFKAAQMNLLAIRHRAVNFRDANQPLVQAEARLLDPGPTGYMLGEILRRAGDEDAAAACFDAARAAIEAGLKAIDASPASAARPDSPEAAAALEQRARLDSLLDWTTEQRKLIKNPKPADPVVIEAMKAMLEMARVTVVADAAPANAGTATRPDAPVTPAVATPKETATTKQPAAVTVHSREELLKLYHKALLRYREAHKDKDGKALNPEKLAVLVSEGLLSAADAGLDDEGRLNCPETGERIFYARNWTPETPVPVLYSAKAPKTLYSDGTVKDRPVRGKQ